jgi:uncharacterized OsmC-like protein
MSTSVIEATRRRFEADADAATATPQVTATVANGRARMSAGAFNWDSDLPASLGGGDLAPSPTAYLLGALAGCAVAFMHDTLAPQLGVRLDGIRAVARCRTDARGLLGMAGALPDLQSIELEVVVDSPEPDDRLAELYRTWVERCPIYLAISGSNPVATHFVRNTTNC